MAKSSERWERAGYTSLGHAITFEQALNVGDNAAKEYGDEAFDAITMVFELIAGRRFGEGEEDEDPPTYESIVLAFIGSMPTDWWKNVKIPPDRLDAPEIEGRIESADEEGEEWKKA